METTFLRSSALITSIGSLFFLIAAFLPYTKVFIEPDPHQKMYIINNMKNMWNIGNVLFGLGSLITVLGLGMISFGFKNTPNASFSLIGIILMAIGAILWSWHVAERIISPDGFANGTNTPFLFVLYSVLTQFGLFLLGIFFLKTELANWLGWMFMIGSAGLFILIVIFKDMPPVVYYLITIIFSISLIVGPKLTSGSLSVPD